VYTVTGVLQNTTSERFATEEHSSLLGPLVSYEENEVLWIQSHVHLALQDIPAWFNIWEQVQSLPEWSYRPLQNIICVNWKLLPATNILAYLPAEKKFLKTLTPGRPVEIPRKKFDGALYNKNNR
jgi:hypothetical protein